VDYAAFDPTWQYNPGRETLAPRFDQYHNVPAAALETALAQYRKDMDTTRLTHGEFKSLLKRIHEADYKPLHCRYQVGNLKETPFKQMQTQGVVDSKIMATDYELWRGTGDTTDQSIPERLFDALYTLLQNPEILYEEQGTGKGYAVFHLVKDTGDGKKIKILVQWSKLKNSTRALKIISMGYAPYDYPDRTYKAL
jgi:hypothetical protein